MVETSTTPMIRVSNLTKRYGEIEALRDVSFEVRKGEIVGFLGPNGAGKTTCLKVMTCFIPATSGTVSIAGMNVSDHSREVRQKFGYLPENAPVYTDMIAYDYLKYVGALRGLSGDNLNKRLSSVAGRCGIVDVLGQVSGTLSKGYRQRLCLAQALIHDPEILILDEPTVGLDPNQVVELRTLIKELGEERTVILSSHILPEVLATCDRTVIIHRGRIVADGTPQQLQEQQAENPPLLVRLATNGKAEPDVLAAFEAQDWVRSARSRVIGIEGEMEFEISGRGTHDIRPLVVSLVGTQGYNLLELRRELLDLEGIFRKLTRD